MRIKLKVAHVYNNGLNATMEVMSTVPAVKKIDRVFDQEKGYMVEKTTVIAPAIPPPAENVEFFHTDGADDGGPGAEPAGELRLMMVDPRYAAEFKEGREFFLDLTPAS